MTDTLERELRRTLADHAQDPAATGPDPWDRVQRGVVRRRRQRTGALAGSVALALAVGGGLGVVQPWAGGDPTQPPAVEVVGVPAAWAALDDGTPRGELGGDPGVLGQVADVLRAAPPLDDGRPVAPDSVRLLFAGDVGGSRVVVAAAEFGPDGDRQVRWSAMVGAQGAAVADLLVAAQGTVGPRSRPAVVVTVGGEQEPRLVALVPRAARVSVSDAASVAADGTVSREWRSAPVEDGVVDTPLASPDGFGTAVVRLESVPSLPAGGPVSEQGVAWPSTGPSPTDAQAMADRADAVVGRGQEARAIDDLEAADPRLVASDVVGLVGAAGYAPESAYRLLYASPDGADTDRGAGGWSSLVAVRTGEGAVVWWSVHTDDGSTSTSVSATVGAAALEERLLLRAAAGPGTDLIGVWDPLGTLGTVSIAGEDAFMPLAVGFRWFPVPAGTEVLVDGEPVPPTPAPGSASWVLPGEERPGPPPLVGD